MNEQATAQRETGAAEIAAELRRLRGAVKSGSVTLREALFRAYCLGQEDTLRIAWRERVLRLDPEERST